MRLCIALFLLAALCSCGSARTENVRSLKNAKNAAIFLMETELSESQHLAAGAVLIAVDPAINLLEHSVFGDLENVEATVPVSDWHQDAAKAEKGVVHQAAKADAVNRSFFAQIDGWTGAIWTALSMVIGTGGVAALKKIMNLRGALDDSLHFGNKALAVDPNDKTAVDLLKSNAISRKRGTGHAKELDAAMNRMRSG